MLGNQEKPKTAKNSKYFVHFNSPEWSPNKDNRSDYIWENKKDGRILLSNSFCDEFQEQPLNVLAEKTFRAVNEYKTDIEKFTTFHDREAYRMEGNGTVDGVKVSLRLLNTRRNNCYFDFVAITPLESVKSRDEDFENFLKSVEFK
jgi:hypothetical protein